MLYIPDKISGETLPIDKPDMFVFTKREPLGVVAAVVPWNSQLFLVAVKIGPALAADSYKYINVICLKKCYVPQFRVLSGLPRIP